MAIQHFIIKHMIILLEKHKLLLTGMNKGL